MKTVFLSPARAELFVVAIMHLSRNPETWKSRLKQK
jgi:hypothetical protein